MNRKDINNALISTIKSPELEGLTTDFSEILLERLTDANEIVKEVPIVGSVVKLFKIGISVKDILFLKKLCKFLWYIRDVPVRKREELIERLERDSKYKAAVGERIMLLLERVDDFEKPKMMANAFKAYLYNEISYPQLQRINFGIDHLFIGDIDELKSFYDDPQHAMDESTRQNLELCGFVDLAMRMDRTSDAQINHFGKLFVEKVLLRG